MEVSHWPVASVALGSVGVLVGFWALAAWDLYTLFVGKMDRAKSARWRGSAGYGKSATSERRLTTPRPLNTSDSATNTAARQNSHRGSRYLARLLFLNRTK